VVYISGTPSRFQATAASHQPYPFGISQRYTVALLIDCRFASAIPIWPISAVHRHILHDSRIVSAYFIGNCLLKLATLPHCRRPQPDFQGYTSRTPQAPKRPPFLGCFHPATTAIQYWKIDIRHCMVSNLRESSGIPSGLLIDQVVWNIQNFSNNKFYIFVICVVLCLTTYNYHSISTDSTRRTQLIKRCAVAKASLTRMQNFLESGDLKVNEIKVRFDELPGIFNKYDTAQDELELQDDTDHFLIENYLKTNTMRLRQNSMSFYILL